jgi:hypothetical protein
MSVIRSRRTSMRAKRGSDTKVAGPEARPRPGMAGVKAGTRDDSYRTNGFTKNRISEMSST